jgi:excisionase family DNA binding protein
MSHTTLSREGSAVRESVLIPLGYTIEAAARESGSGRTKLYAAIKCGRLKARKDGRRTIILRSDLLAYLESLPVLVTGDTSEAPPAPAEA